MLIVAPWSGFWARNVFTQMPALADWFSNPFVRGGVSGIGVITALAGLAELGGAFGLHRTRDDADHPTPG